MMWVFEIERDALLVAIDRVEQRRVIIEVGIAQIHAAAQITAIGSFNLDDTRAEVGEVKRGGGAREKLRHVEHYQPLKRCIRGGTLQAECIDVHSDFFKDQSQYSQFIYKYTVSI